MAVGGTWGDTLFWTSFASSYPSRQASERLVPCGPPVLDFMEPLLSTSSLEIHSWELNYLIALIFLITGEIAVCS